MTAISMKYVFLGCIGLAVLVGFWVSRRIGTVSDSETGFVVPQTSDNMDAFVGEWVLETNDNFDAVLKELGVNSIQRAFAVRLTTHMHITKVNDNEFELKTVTGPVKKLRHMKFGVEFDDEAPTGGQMTGSWKFEDGKMVGTFYFKKDNRKMVIERFKENGKLIEIMTVGEHTSRRTFKPK